MLRKNSAKIIFGRYCGENSAKSRHYLLLGENVDFSYRAIYTHSNA